MKYRNERTGLVIEVNSVISGGGWVSVSTDTVDKKLEDEPKTAKPETVKPKTKPTTKRKVNRKDG